MDKHKRSLGWLGLAAISVGGANFLLNALNDLIIGYGTAAVPFLIIGFLISLLTMPNYLELSLMYPNKVGGIAAMTTEAFRPYNPALSNLAGTCYWFAWVAGTAFASTWTSQYIILIFNLSIPINWLCTLLILLVTVIALFGLNPLKIFSLPFLIIPTILVLFSVFIPLISGEVNWTEATNFQLKAAFEGTFGKITSAMSCFYLIGWFAPTIESVFCYVGETIDPARNLSRALCFLIGLGIFYFILCPIIWVGIVGADTLIANLLGVSLAKTFTPVFGMLSSMLSSWFMLLASMTCLVTSLAGPPRTIAQLSKDGMLPKILSKTSANEVPWVATILTAAAGIVIIWLGTPIWLIAATNFDYLIALSLASIATLCLRITAPTAPRLYRAPKGFIALSMITVFTWLLSTILGFQQFGLPTMLIGISASFVGLLFFIYTKLYERYQQGKSIFSRSLHVKLTATMIGVLIIDAAGYLIAVNKIAAENSQLIVVLEDIFVLVALLTIGVGMIIPGMVIYSAREVSQAADRLVKGPLSELSKSLQLLGSGDLDTKQIETNISLVPVYTGDEIGQMATSFNDMQLEVKKCADAVEATRRGLVMAKRKLIENNMMLNELNVTLEKRVKDRTDILDKTNNELLTQIKEKEKAEEKVINFNKQLINIARYAGTVDIAASALQKLEKILTNINNNMQILRRDAHLSTSGKISELINNLQKQTPSEEQITPDFIIGTLNKYSLTLRNQQQLFSTRLQEVESEINNMEKVIATHSFNVSRETNEDIDLENCFTDILKFHEVEIEQMKIKIACDFKLRKVHTNKLKINQILTNVIDNAFYSLQRSNSENKQLEILTFIDESAQCKICISDNGIGMDNTQIKNIFSSSYNTKTEFGLGLNLSAVFARDIGGDLHATSEGVDKGMKFILLLPCTK